MANTVGNTETTFLKVLPKSHCKLRGDRHLWEGWTSLLWHLTQLPLITHHFPVSLTHSGSIPPFSQAKRWKSRKVDHLGVGVGVGGRLPCKPHSKWLMPAPLVIFPPSLQLFLVVPHSWRSLQKVLQVQEIEVLLRRHELLPSKSFYTSSFDGMSCVNSWEH